MNLMVDYNLSTDWAQQRIASYSAGQAAGGGGGAGASAEQPDRGVARMLRFLRLFKMAKMVRLLKLRQIMVRYAEFAPNLKNVVHIYDFGKLVCGVCLTGHIFSCFFFWVATLDFDHELDGSIGNATADDVLAQSWVTNKFQISGPEAQRDRWVDVYLTALYWAFTTLTTVGYGDITASTNEEMIYCMVAMIAGTGVFATVLGTLSAWATTKNLAVIEGQNRINRINTFLGIRRVPVHLRHRWATATGSPYRDA
jgi:hypothetical protein